VIFDDLKNASIYHGLGPLFKIALEFLSNTDLGKLSLGEHEIQGRDVYAIAQEYDGKPQDKGLWEAHRRYADVQYVQSGHERMGFAPMSTMQVSKQYDEEKDYLLLEGPGNFVEMGPRTFCIFFPADVHMPTLKGKVDGKIRKIVVKVRV
jgi:YhcH/YjgK/YiaL family protein